MLPDASPIGQSFIELQSVDSTNNYATALVHEGMAQHGNVVFAHSQSAGRGQRHKQWFTGEANIAMSVIVNPFNLALSEMFLLSMATAVGVQRFFNNYTAGDTFIKWPNDIYWRDRKAGGILIENIVSGPSWKYAIIGIGININQVQFDYLGNKVVSLKQITGKEHYPLMLSKELCTHLQWSFERLASSPKGIVDDYQEVLYKKGCVVKLKQGSRVFEALIKSVDLNGQLVTQHAVEERFAVGEIEWLH